MLSGPLELPTLPQTGWLIKTRPEPCSPERSREAREKHEKIQRERDKGRNSSTYKQLTHKAASTSRDVKELVWEPLSMSIKERVIQCKRERIVQSVGMWDKERRENLHDIKQKVWSMDPSVTSLIKTSTFIRHRALQYLYHEYFRVPGRSPDTASLQWRRSQFSFPLRRPGEKS